MRRIVATLPAIILLTASVRADFSAFQAGQSKNPDRPSPADTRKKLIAEIDADAEHATGRLNERDAGAATRARQQRILDNIDELLKQQDPNTKSGSQNSPPPKSNAGDASKPPPQGTEPKPNPSQAKGNETTPAKPMPGVDSNKSGPNAKGAEKPNLDKQPGGLWPSRRPGDRQEMEAFARERLIRNYEELLRAYHRNIAESSRKEAD
jgi:hypothetical protein